jgi:AcrR family transcriptional regulator
MANAVSSSVERRAVRREATRGEILDAAWALAREQGLSGLSMRDLGARVGMRAPSLYAYFPSKSAIYDAMFRQGVEQHRVAMGAFDDGELQADPVAAATSALRRFFHFCTADPVRYQLLFQRTIPGFEPSPESYALAVAVLEDMGRSLALAGFGDPDTRDLWTAVATGLVDQQISNDPGGRRWERLIDRAAHMLFAELAPHLLSRARTERTDP